MARAAGGRDSVEVRDMADEFWERTFSRSYISYCRSHSFLALHSLTVFIPTPIMFAVRSALTNIPRTSRLAAHPVLARAYHEKVISHYERPRNVRSDPAGLLQAYF
jgi:hypothetical protein